MTARQLYEGVLIELNKENAPNVLLEDFNYFANKAINNYVNKRYNIYDVNQQTTDDLRVLKATALLKPTKVQDYKGLTMAGKDKMATYEVIMPSDYLHILNCICIYRVNKTYKCYNAGDYWRAPATRLTADMYSLVLDNFWNKPTYKKPYYYIHNVNTNHTSVPTNPYGENKPSDYYNGTYTTVSNEEVYNNGTLITYSEYVSGDENYDTYHKMYWKRTETPYTNTVAGTPRVTPVLKHGTDVSDTSDTVTYHNAPNSGLNENTTTYSYGEDGAGNIIYLGTGLPDTIALKFGNKEVVASNRERGQGIRYGNVSEVRLEIRYGTDTTVFELSDVYVDYIKAPQNIRLTQQEIDLTEDTSQMLEYPDYVCQEIINELVHLIMENISDQRLQTHPVVSLSIANPAQALTPEAAGQSA